MGCAFGIKGLKVYDLESPEIFISQDVVFHEEIFPYKGTELENFDKCPNILGARAAPNILDDEDVLDNGINQIVPQPSLVIGGVHKAQNNSNPVLRIVRPARRSKVKPWVWKSDMVLAQNSSQRLNTGKILGPIQKNNRLHWMALEEAHPEHSTWRTSPKTTGPLGGFCALRYPD